MANIFRVYKDSQVTSDRIRSEYSAATAVQQVIDNAEVIEQTQQELNELLSYAGVDPDFISYVTGELPDSTGALVGTIGAYFVSDGGNLQRIQWNGTAWVNVGRPLLNADILDWSPAELSKYGGTIEDAADAKNGLVRFDENTSIAGTRPRIMDDNDGLYSSPQVLLSLEVNPSVKETKTYTPIRIADPVYGESLAPQNTYRDNLQSLSASYVSEAVTRSRQQVSMSFVDDWARFAISSRATIGSFTGTANEYDISWGTAFVSGQQGIYLRPSANRYTEVCFRTESGAVNALGWVGCDIIGNVQRYSFRLLLGSDNWDVLATTDGVIQSGALPTDNYKQNTGGASVSVGIWERDISVFDIYVNGVHITTIDLIVEGDDYCEYIAHTVSWHNSGNVKIQDSYRADKPPMSSKPLKIYALGDSILYGAFSFIDFFDYIKHTLQTVEGFGDLTFENVAVPSARTSNWVNGGSYSGGGVTINYSLATEDFSDGQYVLVMLGTNDCQGNVSLSTYITNMTTIANKIVSDGAIPIIGIPPIWSSSIGSNSDNIAQYGNRVRNWAIDSGYEVADVRDWFGSNTDLYFDGIHPEEAGLIQVAGAFVEALKNARNRQSDSEFEFVVSTFQNSWALYTSVSLNIPSIRMFRKGNTVTLRGGMQDGTFAPTTVAFDIPIPFRPLSSKFIQAPCYNGTDFGTATLLINKNGTVEVWGASVAASSWLIVEDVSWEV